MAHQLDLDGLVSGVRPLEEVGLAFGDMGNGTVERTLLHLDAGPNRW
jgi:Zn-dependent alcohol dehydrogenase